MSPIKHMGLFPAGKWCCLVLLLPGRVSALQAAESETEAEPSAGRMLLKGVAPPRDAQAEFTATEGTLHNIRARGAPAQPEGWIGIFADPVCSSCEIDTGIDFPTTFWIAAENGISGFAGAEFRIEGLPAGWIAISDPNPAAESTWGDPFGPDGAHIEFATCQMDACVILYSVTLTLLGVTSLDPSLNPSSATLSVSGGTSPGDPDSHCPSMQSCDFTTVSCSQAGQAVVNPSGPVDCFITPDDCAGAVRISGDGVFGFDNTGANPGDGNNDHAACAVSGNAAIDNDVWFCWTAECNAAVTIRTCGQTAIDTKMAVYDGCDGCPGSDGDLLDCSDDDCGTQTELSFTATNRNDYLIRLGTSPGSGGGTGTFTITSSELCAGCQDFSTANATLSSGPMSPPFFFFPFTSADDFTPAASGDITEVLWWGAYHELPYSDAFTITYYDAVGNFDLPGNVIGGPFTQGISLDVADPVDTGELVAGLAPIWEYRAAHPPVPVVAGQCYWAEIINPTDGFEPWYWEWSEEGNQRTITDGPPPNGYEPVDLRTQAYDFAFCLNLPLADPCPAAGACCHDAGQCADEVTEPDCDALGGYWSPNSSCDDAGFVCSAGCGFDNGPPSDDRQPFRALAQLDVSIPWVAATVDDFYVVDPGNNPCRIDSITTWVGHFNGPIGTPADYDGIHVTVYADATPAGPGGQPESDGSHREYFPGGVVYTRFVTDFAWAPVALPCFNRVPAGLTGGPTFELEIPVDGLIIETDTQYWLEILPQVSFQQSGYQTLLMLSEVNHVHESQMGSLPLGTPFWRGQPFNADTCPPETPPTASLRDVAFRLNGSGRCAFPCGDLNNSGGPVDLNDLVMFSECFNRAGSHAGCECADLDDDGQVNLSDLVTFAQLFGRPATGSPPDCLAKKSGTGPINRILDLSRFSFRFSFTFAQLFGQPATGSPPNCQ